MAVLSAPTVTKVVTEGVKKGGRRNPTAAELVDAEDEWLKAVISRIHLKIKSHPLLETKSYDSTIKGQRTYAIPSSLRELEGVLLLDGPDEWRGTAQAGSTTTITLASDFDADSDLVIGKRILITSGTEVDTIKQIVGYNNTTKVATVHEAWATGTDNTSVYLVIDTEIPLYDSHKPTQIWNNYNRGSIQKPTRSTIEDEFILLDYPPDKVYGLEICYYANLMDEDLTGTVWVNVLREWYSLLVQGIAVEVMQRFDDERYPIENSKFETMLSFLSDEETSIIQMQYND